MAHQIRHVEALPDLSASAKEDDVALLRIGGWAPFSCIEYRQNVKSKTKHTGLMFSTVNSLVDPVEFFTVPGVNAVSATLPGSSGTQRQLGRVNDFLKNTQALGGGVCVCYRTIKGNCWGSESDKPPLSELHEPLPKHGKNKASAPTPRSGYDHMRAFL